MKLIYMIQIAVHTDMHHEFVLDIHVWIVFKITHVLMVFTLDVVGGSFTSTCCSEIVYE